MPSTLELVDVRLLAASRILSAGGYLGESLDLYATHVPPGAPETARWRLLTELLELMTVAGYPADEVAFVRDLDPR